MATGDMTARLLLDSKEFEKNINRAKKNSQDFGKKNAEVGKEVVAAFGKITAAIGALKGSKAVFDAMINSSRQMSEAFGAQMTGMKTALDNFIYALANADYTVLADGITAAVNRGKQSAAAANNSEFSRISGAYTASQEGAAYNAAMVEATNKALTTKQRKKALDEAKANAKVVEESQSVQRADAVEKVRAAIAAQANIDISYITEEAINAAVRVGDKRNREAIKAEVKKKYEEYLEKMNQYSKDATAARALYMASGGEPIVQQTYYDQWQAALKKEKEAAATLQPKYADVITQYMILFRNTNAGLRQIVDDLISADAAMNQISAMQKAINEAEAAINADAKGAKKSSGAKVPKEGVIRDSGWKFDIPGVRAMPQIANTFPGQVGMMSIGGESVSEDQRAFDWAIMKDAIKQAKGLEEVNTIVGELSGSFATLGSNIEGTAGGMLTFIGATLDAVQAIIPLIGYIQAEATMRDVNATAAAKEAAAKTLSAYANIPFAGIALGVAGVAAIITAIQSIPKFAEGGIVNRATLGVFGEAGPEAVMPLDKLEEYITPREMRVTGNIKASGKDLVVVLDNYNRVRNG